MENVCVEPFIIAKEAILCKKKVDKESVYHCIGEHNDAHGLEVNNLFEVGHMSDSDVNFFFFLRSQLQIIFNQGSEMKSGDIKVT